MGKSFNGLLAGTRGKVGPVVAQKGVKGYTIVKIKSEPTSKPPKVKQINQRTKFGLVTSFVGNFKKFTDLGFQDNADELLPFAAAVQYNIDNAVTGIAPNYKIDFPNVKLSKGRLESSNTLQLVMAADGDFTVTWDPADIDPAEKAERDLDKVMLVVYDPLHNRIYYNDVFTRGDYKITSTIPRLFAGGPLHAWLMFVSAEGTKASTSEYISGFVITA
ncbi:MAG: DUF6266 family protein [Pedobacter sp.]|uniref:DUF6266 family protein n=1 Tax=Pedobacter sp. TaxID=1411316 RepID=UPI0033971B4F